MTISEAPAPPRRRGEITRLEGFSDGVFAFSATLLVVSLDVPRSYAALVANLRGLVAFGLAFVVLLQIWYAHNRFFRRYGLQDPATIVLNSVLLFVVLFYVYPLKFLALGFVSFFRLGDAGVRLTIAELGSAFAIYGVGFAAIFLCIALLYWHASRSRALDLEALERFDARTDAGHYLLYVVVGLASVGLALGGWGLRFGLPGWIYAFVGPLSYWHGTRRGRRRENLSASPS
jgi:hypothetical protein